MAIARDGFFLAVRGVKLAQILDDQVAADAVARDEREGFLHDVEFPERGKLVHHQKEPVLVLRFGPPVLESHLVGGKPDDHVDQNAYKRSQARFVGWLRDDVEAHGRAVVHQVSDPESRARDVAADDGIAVEREIRFRRGKHGPGLFLRAVDHVPAHGSYHRMHLAPHVTVLDHLGPEFRDGPAGIGQDAVHLGQRGDVAVPVLGF